MNIFLALNDYSIKIIEELNLMIISEVRVAKKEVARKQKLEKHHK